MFFNRFSQNLLNQRNGVFPNAKVMSNSPNHDSAAPPNPDEVNERDELRGPKASPKPIDNKLIGGKGKERPTDPTTIYLNDDSLLLTE